MNEQLQQAVAVLIDSSLKAFEAGASFMAAEIPDVVHQLLMWHAVYSAVMTLFGVAILVVFVVTSHKQIKWWMGKDPNDDYNDMRITSTYGPLAMLNLVWLLPIIAAFNLINLTWLQIWIAPKVWLIEYAARMLK